MRAGLYSKGRESPSAAESRETSTSRICTPDSAKSAADRLLPRKLAISTLSCSSSSICRRTSFIWLLMSRTEDCRGGGAGAGEQGSATKPREWVGGRHRQASGALNIRVAAAQADTLQATCALHLITGSHTRHCRRTVDAAWARVSRRLSPLLAALAPLWPLRRELTLLRGWPAPLVAAAAGAVPKQRILAWQANEGWVCTGGAAPRVGLPGAGNCFVAVQLYENASHKRSRWLEVRTVKAEGAHQRCGPTLAGGSDPASQSGLVIVDSSRRAMWQHVTEPRSTH